LRIVGDLQGLDIQVHLSLTLKEPRIRAGITVRKSNQADIDQDQDQMKEEMTAIEEETVDQDQILEKGIIEGLREKGPDKLEMSPK
jgi:hypothetical protein